MFRIEKLAQCVVGFGWKVDIKRVGRVSLNHLTRYKAIYISFVSIRILITDSEPSLIKTEPHCLGPTMVWAWSCLALPSEFPPTP